MARIVRETVKVNKLLVTYKVPVLSCGHTARHTLGRVKKKYNCFHCERKADRASRNKSDSYIEE
jgi:hypothetical protein